MGFLMAELPQILVEAKVPATGTEQVVRDAKRGFCPNLFPKELRWELPTKKQGGIEDLVCFNKRFFEPEGYYKTTKFLEEAKSTKGPIDFFESDTSKRIFRAPVGRTMDAFLKEADRNGYLVFRDDEVNWDYVRVFPKGGALITDDGVFLGKNAPDVFGNKYVVNLGALAGLPPEELAAREQAAAAAAKAAR